MKTEDEVRWALSALTAIREAQESAIAPEKAVDRLCGSIKALEWALGVVGAHANPVGLLLDVFRDVVREEAEKC